MNPKQLPIYFEYIATSKAPLFPHRLHKFFRADKQVSIKQNLGSILQTDFLDECRVHQFQPAETFAYVQVTPILKCR